MHRTYSGSGITPAIFRIPYAVLEMELELAVCKVTCPKYHTIQPKAWFLIPPAEWL